MSGRLKGMSGRLKGKRLRDAGPFLVVNLKNLD